MDHEPSECLKVIPWTQVTARTYTTAYWGQALPPEGRVQDENPTKLDLR